VVEHITPESLATDNGDRKNSRFLEDETGTRCRLRHAIARHID